MTCNTLNGPGFSSVEVIKLKENSSLNIESDNNASTKDIYHGGNYRAT